ncbi:MAG: M20 family metallo-hydrolase [Synergistaceae bacterium]|nr:M20 family metallo-hydrolase [Synergistaceae bacterium]
MITISGLKDNILKEIEHLESEMIKSLCRIVRFPAVSPHNGGRGEEAKAQEISKILIEQGLTEGAELEWIRIPDEKSHTGNRPSIILRTPGKTQQRLWILCHIDVVSAGDRSSWNNDPFEPVIKDGKVYARGTNDNGQAVIAMIYALKALKNLKIVPEYEICLGFVADEETGSHYSIEPMVNNGIVDFREDDMILVPDGGDSKGDFIEIAEKGLLQIEFTIIGKQTHASSPNLGSNACRAANILSVTLDEELHKAFPDCDELFTPNKSTFEPTRRYTNVVSINIVPGVERISFDCRVLPHIKLDDVIKIAEKVMESVMSQTGVKVKLNVINRSDAAPCTSPDSTVAKILSKAINEVLNVKPRFGGVGGGTFSAFFRHKGISSVVWEQNTEGQTHQPNEYAIIKYMLNNAKVFALLMSGA